MTTVVHCRRSDFDVYIGRRNNLFPESKWHNPFRIGKDGTRAEVIAKYRLYVLSRPDLMESLHELKDKRLGCWCSPKPCHGDVLADLCDNPHLFHLHTFS